MKLQHRQDVPVEHTWDPSIIYKDDQSMKDALNQVEKQAESLKGWTAKGKTLEQIMADIKVFESLYVTLRKIGTYSSLYSSADMTDVKNQERTSLFSNALQKIGPILSGMSTSFSKLEDESLMALAEKNPPYKRFFEEIKREKKHLLSDETEHALSMLSQALGLPYTIYEKAKLADMSFSSFKASGKEFDQSFVLFENHYQYEPDKEVRREAFKNFSKKIREYHNTIGTALITQVQKEKQMSLLRGHASVQEYLLFEQEISLDIYNTHLDTFMEKLAPVMRKYAGLIAEVHSIEDLHFADLKLPIDTQYSPTITIEESKAMARDALSIMGEEYLSHVDTMLNERAIDWAQNIGKSTGGFCTSPYDVPHGFILMSFTNLLSEVFTLVHELGHAVHFMMANKEQTSMGTNPSQYFIEAPSTINELLLTNFLTKKSDDPTYKRYVITSLLGNTYYHNCVTHFLEAYFQREVYRLVDQGAPLTPSKLDQLKKETLETFWGDAVIIDDDAALTWMRQPHYYMGLYPYTYSAGLALATKMAVMINEDPKAAEDWIEVLKAGGTKSPVELAQVAGVDIHKNHHLVETIDYIESLVDEAIALSQ